MQSGLVFVATGAELAKVSELEGFFVSSSTLSAIQSIFLETVAVDAGLEEEASEEAGLGMEAVNS